MATREVEAMYVLSFVSIKEVRNGYKGGGGHVCFVICQYKGGEEWLQGSWRPCIVWSFVSIKEVRNGYKGGGGHVCFVMSA